MFDYSLPDARQKILDGFRIVPVMTPDDALAENYVNPLPEYEECYPLNHVVLRDHDFWGITSGTNQPYLIAEGLAPAILLGYTNSAPLYFSTSLKPMVQRLSEPQQSMNMCPLRQYKAFRFLARKDATLVWDGEYPDEFKLVREAIQEGSYFRLVFEEEGGLVLSMGVDLPMYFVESKSMTINTHPVSFPEFFSNPQSLIDALNRSSTRLLDPDISPTLISRPTVKMIGGFFSVRSDGTYYGVQEILTGKPRRWQQARLYAY